MLVTSRSPVLVAVRMLHCLVLAYRQIAAWRARAGRMEDPGRRRQAIASLEHKTFHSLGAAMYGAELFGRRRRAMVRFAVAYQTLSDYLDNLCDRSLPQSFATMHGLHRAMVDALHPGSPPETTARWGGACDYSRPGGRQADPYVRDLVARCRLSLAQLQVRSEALDRARHLAGLYSEMQALKHGPPGSRRRRMQCWYGRCAAGGVPVAWWEFAAASGSTLGVFALVVAGAHGRPAHDVERTVRAYMPWICGLHILLDYYVDRSEDRSTGELNFAACYPPGARERRMVVLYGRALGEARALWDPVFHRLVVAGMAALYLTDPKARRAGRPLLEALERADPWIRRLLRWVTLWRAITPRAPALIPPAIHPSRRRLMMRPSRPGESSGP